MIKEKFWMENSEVKKNINGKKILFFSPKFFGYEKEIELTLKNLGANVDYYDDRPANNFLTKALIRIDKNILKKKIETYYTKIVKNTKDKKYDYIFFLTPDSLTKKKLLELKEGHKESKFILYMWDSLKNRKNVLDLIELFDEVYSFDKNDSQKYNFNFRPLFYISEYEKINEEKPKLLYDLTFIGTGHSDRYRLVKDIKEKLLQIVPSINIYTFMYLPSKILYIVRKIIDSDIRESHYKEFDFNSLTKNEMIDVIKKTNVILDIQHPNQTGLTMRTFEILGAKKKLITTNKDIINYDFYDPINIYVLDREKKHIDIKFFNNKYQELNQEIYSKYSILGWVNEIFEK